MGTTRTTRDGKAGKARRTGFRRFLPTWKWTVGTLLGVLLLAAGAIVVVYQSVSVPKPNKQATQQSNIWKAADGSVIARTGKVNRENVKLDQVPTRVQHAFVALENKSFYQDKGIDPVGTARGVARTVLGKSTQGGSTITQQYVKNYYLDQDQTVARKLKEMVISIKVDRTMSKGEILRGYLNTSYFGRGAYGIQAASRAYFGVDCDKLTTAQGAYLAALVQAPSQYDMAVASSHGKRLALGRWNHALDNMVEKKWLPKKERDGEKFPKLRSPSAKTETGLSGQTGYLVNAATQYLTSTGKIDDKTLAAGGWTIQLSVDPKREKQLEQAVKRKLTSKLDPKSNKVDADAQTGAASVDPKTGNVLALYGGRDYFKHYVNNATRRDYQAASTFKPIVLAAALENHATTQSGQPITPSTVYDGTSGRSVVGGKVPFAPPNEDNRDYGRITVQKGMNYSVNSVFAQLAQDAGLANVRKTAVALGLPADTPAMEARPSIALGVSTPSPLQVAGAYATLDNHGKKVTPRLVTSATRDGEKLKLPRASGGKQVVKRSTADTVTQVLRGVVDDPSGSGAVASDLGRQVAGKTGTSDDNKSAWFVGYTSELVTSVGMFGENSKGGQTTLHGVGGVPRVNGGGFPTQIWTGYMQSALKNTPAHAFDLKAGGYHAPAAPPSGRTGSTPPSAPPSDTAPPSAPPPSHEPSSPPAGGGGQSPPPVQDSPPQGQSQPPPQGGGGNGGGQSDGPPPPGQSQEPPPTGGPEQPGTGTGR